MFLAMTAGQPTAIRVHPFVALTAQLAGEHEMARTSIDEAFRIGFDDIFEWVFGVGVPLAMLMTEALCAYRDDRVFKLEPRLRWWSGYMPVGGMAPALVFGPVDHQLALVARMRGDLDEARRLIDASVSLSRKMGALPFVARSLLVSAEIADEAGDVARATTDAREAARLASRFELRQVAERSATLLAKHGAAPVRGARVSGTSTAIVFTDIESSTASAAALGDAAWFERLRDHDTTVRKLVAQNGGREVKHLGDGFMLTFPTVHAAVAFGVALQRTFTDGLVRVRAGVHVGPVIEEADDVFGTTVNIAARVSAAAKGGETLVSEDVIAVTGDAPVGAPRVANLKGVTEPMKLYPLVP
jgi:class 3 adenylate cyclase